MEVFKDLTIRGSEDALQDFIEAIMGNVPRGWSRDESRENELKKVALDSEDHQYAFSRESFDGTPGATLFMIQDGETLRFTNIVPHDVGSLTRGQYNALIDDFVDHLVEPVIAGIDVTYEVTAAQVGMTHWLSEEAVGRLERFSSTANKGTGSSHPRDFERWASFLIQAHSEGSSLDAETLQRWLIEEKGWPAETADELAIQYEFARNLLGAYDR